MEKKNSKRDAEWADAKQRCRLNEDDVRMAKELGLSPRSLIKNIPNRSEPWKLPVKEWIHEMYAKLKAKQAKKKRPSMPEPEMPRKKKRDAVFLQYTCKDGSFTVAKSASIGLMYWYGRIIPQKPIENPQLFSVHIVQTSIPFPYHPLFLSLVVAGVERTFGTAPEIAPHLLEPAHSERFAKLDFTEIEKHLKKGTAEIVEYEQACLDILNWLKGQGEITSMIFDEPIQPPNW